MTINDPIIVWGLGAGAAGAAWLVRRLDKRIRDVEGDVAILQTQMAGHDSNKEMLDRMYTELQALTKLTSRIAGHLNIS